MTPDEARTIVLCKYPDAEPHSNDYYWHWIGRKILSESFEENRETMRLVLKMPNSTEEETDQLLAAAKAIEQAAEDKAWVDAAQKILKEAV